MKNKFFKDANNKFNLFNNDKTILLVSFITAIIIWIIFSYNDTSYNASLKVNNIPISVELSESATEKNLTAFFTDQSTANVNISGNALTLSKVKSSDIKIEAQQSSEISESGTYELNLIAKSNNNFSDFNIDQNSISPNKITVFIDQNKTSDFEIKDELNYSISDGYFAPSAYLTPNSITISGPKTIVSNIVTVATKYNIPDTLSESKTYETPLVFYDKDKNTLLNSDLKLLTISQKMIQCDITVLKKISSVFKASFFNAPLNFDNSRINISPNVLDIAVPEKLFETAKEFKLPNYDFSKINLEHNTFTSTLEMPEGYKNLSNKSSAEVSINLDGYTNKQIDVNKFEFLNAPAEKNVKSLTTSVSVEINGLREQIDNISSNDITAVVDLSEKNNISGTTELPVSFKINNYDSCWIYGNYSISVTVS